MSFSPFSHNLLLPMRAFIERSSSDPLCVNPASSQPAVLTELTVLTRAGTRERAPSFGHGHVVVRWNRRSGQGGAGGVGGRAHVH